MRRSKRRGAALLCAAVLAVSLPGGAFPAGAETEVLVIRTAEDLEALSRKCSSEDYSLGKTVRLEADIQLSGRDFQPIPVFAGTFEGNGHRIFGLRIEQKGSNLGLFRYLETEAVVRNLTVEGEIVPDGSRKNVGGIAGTNRGTIQGCTFDGTVQALESAGGIAGYNEETGVIEDCVNGGELTGNRKIGGIAGENEGTILSSRNEGTVNASPGGVEEDSDGMTSISLDRETIADTVMREKINDVGGIAGLSAGTIRECTNTAQIGYDHAGYNVGGIVGRQNGVVMLCDNEGDVAGRKDVGGIAGQLEPFLTIYYEKDTFDRINDQIDVLSDTTDSMTEKLWNTTDASEGNLDRIDDIMKEIRDLTRDTKDERRIKRDDFGDQADKKLDEIDELLANMEFDLGNRDADRAANRLRGNVNRAKELVGMLNPGASGGGELATGSNASEDYGSLLDQIEAIGNEYIIDEDSVLPGDLQVLLEIMTELQGCAQGISDDTEILITRRIDGIVDGIRDVEDDLDNLRIASKELLDLTRDYKDELIDNVDGLDADVTVRLDQLYDELDDLSDTLKSGKNDLRGEKERLDTQLDEVQDIITEGRDRVRSERDKLEDDEESLFEDVSETVTDLSNGMVLSCANRGAVSADYQAGGVVGTIGVEVSLDPEEDIEEYGDKTLRMDRYASASVRQCRNDGDVTAQQDYAGGIAGAARLGVLKGNQNYGDVSTVDGDYAGGIAGSSQGTVDGSFVLCEVAGNAYTGGVAGLGKTVRDNCAMVSVVSEDGEWLGSIAGDREDEGTIAGNVYVDDGLGAVDGITFRGEAAGIAYEELLELENLPAEFHSLTVTFLADGQVVERVICDYGSALAAERMPDIPAKDGFFHHWEDIDLSDIRRNYKVNAVYVPWTTTIACSDDPMPLLLAEGAYYGGASLTAEETEGKDWKQQAIELMVSPPFGYRIQKVISYQVEDPENENPAQRVKLHVLAKGAGKAAIVRDGYLEIVDAVRDGDYLEFEADAMGTIVLLRRSLAWPAAGVLLLVGVMLMIWKKRKGRG